MKESIRVMALIGLFVALFLWIFQPFGFYSIQGNSLPYALLFGLITFITGTIHEFIELHILKLRKDLPSWTFWKWLISALVLIMFIALGNLLLASHLEGWSSYSLSQYLVALGNTAAIGIFPTSLFGAMKLLGQQKHYTELAESLHSPDNAPAGTQSIVLQNKAGDDLKVDLSNILFIEVNQNYLNVHCLDKNEATIQTIRNSMKNIVSDIGSHENLLQCHRSFLVNMDHVNGISGNSQGLILHFSKEDDLKVPVSRPYIPAIRQRTA